ncbi:hypothetical protein NS226_15145 [Aureimonas ureilytica]|uniref:Uncharacterized protein n=1 Tax=Aureimonas ureilytica TaxID=401562 RepID=A0A175R5J4_9HYPH|nr:hypothetical protein [Aureimonas ureilytica]KTQ92635.1 hypothetical protein NS226_15145 [Aureimonas ureilytica]
MSEAQQVRMLLERCQAMCAVSEAAIRALEQDMASSHSLPLELGEMFEGLANSYLDLAAIVSARHRVGHGAESRS